MIDLPTAISDSRLASVIARFGTDEDGSGDGRSLALGGSAVALLSTVSSVVSYGMLPDQLRIHWTLGMGPYHGPEVAPTALVLIAFPLCIAGGTLGAYWLEGSLRDLDAVATVRPNYVLTILGTLGFLLALQVALILMNL